jgi:NAD(P)-dependent dehydrogenase (short-subunit alcohol dehydrogenase family)/acyl carrier protein
MVQECLDGYGEVDGLEEDRRSGGGLSISGDEVPPVSAPTLRGERPEVESIFTALGEMWVHGVEVDWTGVLDGRGFTHVELPSYAFQRKRFWLDGGSGAGDVRSIGLESIDHPLLGAVVELAGGEGWLFSGRVSLKDSAWLLDHVVMDTILFPGTGLLDIVVCAGQAIGCDVVRELVLEAPLVFDGVQDMRLQVMVGGSQRDGERSVSVFSCPGDRSDVLDGGSVDGEGWTRHASGVLVATGSEDANASRDLAFGSSVGADAMWPPQGANRIEVDDLYERLADVGLDYGPAFQGLTGAWQRGDEIFCEASLLEEHMARAGSFAVHPALLDSALHGVGLLNTGGWSSDRAQGKADMRLPFSWENVRVVRNGARSLRVRLAIPSERNNRVDAEGEADRSDGVVSLVAVDESGMPVVSVGSLLTRVVSSEQLQAMRGNPSESLFDVQWRGLQTGVSTGDAFGASEDWVLLGSDDSRLGHVLGNTGTGVRVHKDLHALREATDDSQASAPEVVLMDATDSAINESYGGEDTPIDGDLAARAKVIACAVLSVLQDWISDERFAESRLVLVSSEAVRAGIDDRLAGLSSSGVWGMVRSAQSEHPGRLMLIDIDRREGGEGIEETQLGVLLKTAIASREPQLAIRDGVVLVPMLARVTMGAMDGAVDDDDDARESNANAKSVAVGAGGSILITGGTGGLGALVARHLVVEHHVGCVVLVSRSGLKAPGADELKAELVRLGAQVHVAACDVSNREAVAGLLEEIPVEFPLRGVIHAAGALDDGMIGSLTSESVERVFAPKVEGAWNLHELTADMDLSMFMLFSSGAGTMGAPGQSNYAAANAFLDSLAAYRRARGLQGTSIAWGLWEQAGGMTSGLEVADMARLARTGVIALTAAEGLELFDAACGSSEASLVAARFDKRVLRADARAGMLHVLLRGMTRTPAQRVADDGSLMRQLAGLSEVEQESLILDLVRREVATVLGHMSHTTIDPHIAFKDLGFDSLAAVELRNRLNAATGLRLSATLIFDYPNAAVLTHRLRDELRPSNAELAGESEETEVRKVLASIPLGRLRRAGLLDMLLQLGDHVDPAERSAAVDDPDTVDTMGIEDLVLAATRGSEGEADERI